VLFAYVAMIFVLIPAVLVTGGEIIGFNDCPMSPSPSDHWPCSNLSRIVLIYGLVLIGMPPAVRMGVYLQKIVSNDHTNTSGTRA
jgi:hypothetical protein